MKPMYQVWQVYAKCKKKKKKMKNTNKNKKNKNKKEEEGEDASHRAALEMLTFTSIMKKGAYTRNVPRKVC